MSLSNQHPSTLLRRLFLLSILLLPALLLAACGKGQKTTTAPVSVESLYNILWVLGYYGDPANPTTVGTDIAITAQFTPDGQLIGSGVCNYYTASFQAQTDGLFTTSGLTSTDITCQSNSEVEKAYLAAIKNAKSFTYNNEGRLQITYINDYGLDNILLFGTGAATLTRNTWVLTSYGDANAQQTVPVNLVLSAYFTPDGILSGLAGCNHYAAVYSVQEGKLTVQAPVVTHQSCTYGMDVEQIYLGALSHAQGYHVAGRRLIVTYDDGNSLLNFTSTTLPLAYSLWSLAAVDGMAPASGVSMTAVFAPDPDPNEGAVTGLAGCNIYQTDFLLNGSQITLQKPAVTGKTCSSAVMEAENSFLNTLQSAKTYQVIGHDLLIDNGTSKLTFVANRTPLEGAGWTLVALGEAANPQALKNNGFINAQLSREPGDPSGKLSGSTSCGQFSATYTADSQQIQVDSPQSTTQVSCPSGVQQQEQQYFQLLTEVKQYFIAGTLMVFSNSDNTQVLIFQGTPLGMP